GAFNMSATNVPPLPDQLLGLLEDNLQVKEDLMEFRGALEALSCAQAALRANAPDKEIIRNRFEEWLGIYRQKNRVSTEELKADFKFHMSIAEASHNLVLPHFMDTVFKLLEHSLQLHLEYLDPRNENRVRLEGQHRAMMDAVLNGNAEAAKQATSEHLATVTKAILETSINEARYRRSSARLKNLQRTE
ncbi:MAG: FCD domain-containing protein, partial [Pseudomonadota bacterium]